ncbi:6-phosphogluconolactonase, cycloisomerase 2 family [Nonomuraea solani]|uniref:6-phosphogluconolactonase, cycloisomerase 2 family n=1 Tax=Nonomuraea solani TaxID=1144553 RepID=A0A1H6D044_9ACTN|nr:beta-propeller fold lactonase family protein [Nonomuraea solani]SEG78205.1 6-phosphogluconolactonase, cycloisomerase 2 family [Nonomuraea solani]
MRHHQGLRLLSVTALLVAGTLTQPEPAPAGERAVYVTNSESSDISRFVVDAATGRPILTGDRVTAGPGVRQMALTPDARLAYASNAGNGTISAYKIGPQGRLIPQATVPTGGDTPLGIVVTPGGRFLYVAHVFSRSVAGFAIAPGGRLSPLSGSPTQTSVANPRGVAVTPDGRFLYVGHGDPGPDRLNSIGAISTFAIKTDGTLTEIETPIRLGRFCGAMTIVPDGSRLYLTCSDTSEIHGFAIGADGALTALPHSPYAVPTFPEGIIASPDGRFVYVASPAPGTGGTPPGDGAVSGFAVGADGALTPVRRSPLPAGIGPVGITILPDGRFLYASTGDPRDDGLDGALSAFGLDAAGTMRPLPGSPFPTGGVGPAYGSAAVLPDQGPVASFTPRVVAGRTVTFDASASTDPDGQVARHHWTFGDGTSLTTAGPRATHTYPRAGTFRVTLTVTDNEGCSTALISTGQAVLCNGTPAATTARDILIR